MSALIEKIQRYAVQESCGCWRWVGARQPKGGTPAMQWEGKVGNVRRFILLDRGVNMKGYLAGTSCGNQSCVNPEHVIRTNRSKTSIDSAAKMDAAAKKLRAMRTAHAIRERGCKLSMEQARAIRQDIRPQREIAADYGVTQHTIYSIKSGQMWREYSATNPFAQLMR